MVEEKLHLAKFWGKEKLKNIEGIRCSLCARRCFIAEGKRGFCMVRENVKGKLFTLNYGRIVGLNVDPIEKKPLFHFFPGSSAMSYACFGCNWRCQYCLTPDTVIITQKGIMTLKELFERGKNENSDDHTRLVDNLEIVTHEGTFHRIIKAFKHTHKGNLIIIKPYYLPEIRCTPEHEIFVLSADNGMIKKRATDITLEDYLVIPKKFEGANFNILDVKELLRISVGTFRISRFKLSKEKIEKIIQMSKDGIISRNIGKTLKLHPTYVRRVLSIIRKTDQISSLIFGENSIIEKNGFIKFKTEKQPFIPRFIRIDGDFGKLLGIYCAEGNVNKSSKRPNSYNLVFSFGKHEKDLINETKRLLKKFFPIEPRLVERKTTITIEIGKSSVSLIFKLLCGSRSVDKKVPWIINQSDENVIRGFIDGYIKGDGWVGEKVIDMCTISRKLSLGLYWLLLKIGILASFYEFEPSKKSRIENRMVNQSTFYRVKIVAEKLRLKLLSPEETFIPKSKSISAMKFKENDLYYFVSIRDIRNVNYNGEVYNLEIDGNPHSYLANFISVGNCCNWMISHDQLPNTQGEYHDPEYIVKLAVENNCKTVSHTYTEPTIFYEFAYDVAKLAHKEDIRNTFVTNGYMTPEALDDFKYLDAATVDFKASADPKFLKKYSQVMMAEPIFEFLKELKKHKIHTEITNLVIPKVGDDLEKFRKLVKWIVNELGTDIPFHIIRFFPNYKMLNVPSTPIATLEKFADDAKKLGMTYVYVGNVPRHKGENTYCPNCKELLIERIGFESRIVNLKKDRCGKCSEKINIVLS